MGRQALGGVGIAFLVCILQHSLTAQSLPFRKGTPFFTNQRASGEDSIRTNLDDYIWPTDAGRLISSVFAEYRRSHFHGGIDISTGDETGFRVFASRDGYVSRIVVGPTGYGKMLWLRHADGYYTTYAHLKSYNEPINARVRAEQLQVEKFPILVECGPNDFPVKKGDVIAYTGESGTGSPHLHFEIRDENKDFVNPFLCRQFVIRDDSIPRIQKIAFTPIGDQSLIDGLPATRIVQIANPIQTHIPLREIVYVSGSMGISVDVRDRINGSRFKNGIYSHQLFIDDSLIYTVKLNRAPSEDDHQVGLYYDHDLMEEEDGRFERLYTTIQNPLHIYSPKTNNAGVIESSRFAEGVHSFKIVTSDYWMNATEVTGSMVFSRPAEFGVLSHSNALKITPAFGSQVAEVQISLFAFRNSRSGWRLHATHAVAGNSPYLLDLTSIVPPHDILRIVAKNQHGSPSAPQFVFPASRLNSRTVPQLLHTIGDDAVTIHIRTEEEFTSVPSIAVIEGTTTRRLAAQPLDYNSYTVSFRPSESFAGKRTAIAECVVNGTVHVVTDTFTVTPIVPDQKKTFAFDNGSLQLATEPGSVFKTMFLEVSTLDDGDNNVAYALRPRNAVLNRGIDLTLRKPITQPKQGLYFRSRISGWRLVATHSGQYYYRTRLRRTLGEIAIRVDAQPPRVSQLTLPGSASRPQSISFRVSDSRSGVEYKELKLYIDDEFVIPEIDGEHRRVAYRFSEPLHRGSHKLRIVVKDRMGNTTNVERAFTVR